MLRVTVVGLALALAACGGSAPTAHHAAEIDPDAVIEMTPDGFPKMYERLGATDFARANVLSRTAARKASGDESCDRVDLVGVSDASSSAAIEIYVDCKNGQRFRYGEADLR